MKRCDGWQVTHHHHQLLLHLLPSFSPPPRQLLRPVRVLRRKSGLVVILIALALIFAVNAHDLIAHMAGVDYILSLVAYDAQLGLVEFAVPTVQPLGSILTFIAVLFLLIKMERGSSYRLEKHAPDLRESRWACADPAEDRLDTVLDGELVVLGGRGVQSS